MSTTDKSQVIKDEDPKPKRGGVTSSPKYAEARQLSQQMKDNPDLVPRWFLAPGFNKLPQGKEIDMSDTLAIEAELKRLGKVAKGMADDLATVLERMHTIAEGPRTMTEIRVYDGQHSNPVHQIVDTLLDR